MARPRSIVTEGYVWEINAHDFPGFEVTITPQGKVGLETTISADPKTLPIGIEMPAHVAAGLAHALARAAEAAPKPKRIRKPKADKPQQVSISGSAGNDGPYDIDPQGGGE